MRLMKPRNATATTTTNTIVASATHWSHVQ
jgi:hypothetical protein